jgi:protein arginine kinase activator
MQCQICNNNEATIHLTEIHGDVHTEMHLCESCAAEQGIAAKSQIPLNELLSSLLASAPEEANMYAPTDSRQKCPRCGFSLEQLKNEPLLGCPYDYEMYEKSLLPLIENTQDGKTVHCGKVPTKVPRGEKDLIELMNLRNLLEDAIRTEDYETAAKLRDKIAQYETDRNK